jgi:hypothetical protein
MPKKISSLKKSTGDFCSDADGSLAYAPSVSESSEAYTQPLNAFNPVQMGGSMADPKPHDEPDLLNADDWHKLIQALEPLGRIAIFAKSPVFVFPAQIAWESIREILVIGGDGI